MTKIKRTPEEARAHRNGQPRKHTSKPEVAKAEVEAWMKEDAHYRQVVEAIRETLRARDQKGLQAH